MLQLASALNVTMSVRKRSPGLDSRPLVERVRERITRLGCGCEKIWARGAGSHVLVGLRGEDAYARVSPIRGSLYGLAFRNESGPANGNASERWEGLLLIDTLADVVEHALVAVDALPLRELRDEPPAPPPGNVEYESF